MLVEAFAATEFTPSTLALNTVPLKVSPVPAVYSVFTQGTLTYAFSLANSTG